MWDIFRREKGRKSLAWDIMANWIAALEIPLVFSIFKPIGCADENKNRQAGHGNKTSGKGGILI